MVTVRALLAALPEVTIEATGAALKHIYLQRHQHLHSKEL